MTYKRQGRQSRHRAPRTAIGATLVVVGGFLASTMAPALAATTTTTVAATTTTAAPTTTTTAVPGSDCAAAASGSALDRAGWAASTNAPSSTADAPANAIDGNYSTRFSTNEDQASGIFLRVSFGRAESFYQLKMAVPNSPTDYARSFDVDVYNGTSWATVARCTGTTNPETVSFVPQTGTYLKVVLTSAVNEWWSVDELNLFGQTPAATTTTTATPSIAHTTASLTSSVNPASVGEAITYTAKVLPEPTTGTVNFFNNGAPIAGCDKVALSAGEATCASTYFSSERQGVQAFYSGAALSGPSSSAIYDEVINLPGAGYWLATGNGQVFGTGAAESLGGVATSATSGAVVGIAASPSAKGYWVVTANGGVSAMGDAKFYGDLPDLGKHISDVVAIAPTTDGLGYYLVGADGGFFTFGDAKFHGSLPGIHIRVKDVVGMVATPGGGGYLLVGSDGGVFTFGATHFYGSLPGLGKHVHDIRAILPSSTGRGYILVGADGGAFNFGSGAKFHGSLPGEGIRVADIVGLALSPDNGGYLMAGSDGRVYGFGDAQVGAMPAGVASNLPVAAIAGT
jgi:F5/8 type C domain